MKKEYWLVIIIYISMQFSGLIGTPLLHFLGISQGSTYPVWLIVKFVLAITLVLVVLRKDLKDLSLRKAKKPLKISIKWAVFGVLLAFLSQFAAAFVERLFGINLVSNNTQQLAHIISSFPLAIMVSSVLGPALEEIVFRRILFGYFHKHFNFFIAACISSFLFAAVHLEPAHILRYFAMGFAFAFLYVKRNSLVAPMFAHVMMNTLVVLFQF